MIINFVSRRAKRLWQKSFPRPEPKPTGSIRCREIEFADLNEVVELLTKGFWQTSRDHWVSVMDVLTMHRPPEGFPKYGFMLENNGKAVGVLLTIFSEHFVDGARQIWCCGSSYYVEPGFRFFANLMLKRAQRFKDVTYLDLASTPKRWVAMQRQGYQRIAQGVHVGLTPLCWPMAGTRVQKITPELSDWLQSRVPDPEIKVLTEHARFRNVISILCEHEGNGYPFVFGVRHRYGIPFAVLFYSRSQADFIKFAGTLGRFFLKQGIPLLACDADGPIASIPGRFMMLWPKFWRGANPPRLGDLAYTEIAMFGVI